MARPAQEEQGPASRQRGQKAFAFIGISVVVVYAVLLFSLLFFSDTPYGFGGGSGRAGHSRSTLVSATSLVLLTAGYLALLALWAALRKKWSFLGRHVVAAGIMWLLVVLYLNAFGSFDFHRRDWNRAFANASVVLYAVTLSIGPLARLWPHALSITAWRRETGIWATIAAIVHVVIFWEGAYGFAGWRRFFHVADETGASTNPLLTGTTFHLANVIGLIALAYALVLMATSNEASQRWFKAGWAWLMKRSTTMWLLVLLHVWAFAYVVQGMGLLRLGTLWGSFFAVLILQTAAFTKTVWLQRRRDHDPDPAVG